MVQQDENFGDKSNESDLRIGEHGERVCEETQWLEPGIKGIEMGKTKRLQNSCILHREHITHGDQSAHSKSMGKAPTLFSLLFGLRIWCTFPATLAMCYGQLEKGER